MNNEYMELKDLYLAALIYAKGIQLKSLRREGRTCWFIFTDRSTCERLQQEYFAKTVSVIAKDYAEAIRTLKDMVFANA